MTWSKCHKNCVISGQLDAFCLVCESHLKSQDDLDAHIEKPIHKKNLESAPYFEKYKNDRIRKVKKGYYCEFCNLLIFTAAKVGLHVVEEQHQYNRSSQLLRRVNSNVIAFDNIYIDDKSWNGFVEDTCTICNSEFENEDIHKTDNYHTLNVILKKIDFIDDKLVYRKLDESSFQCLICNSVFASSTLASHVEKPDHINKLKKCREIGQEIQDLCENKKTTKEEKIKDDVGTIEITTKEKELNDNINKLPKKEQSKSTTPKVENIIKSDGVSKKSNDKLLKDDKKSPLEVEKYICTVLGAKNYVVPLEDGKSMCLLCDWTMETKNAAVHVSSRHHLTILKMHQTRLEKMCNDVEQMAPKLPDRKKAISEKKVNVSDNGKISDCLPEFHKNNIEVSLEMGIASCRKCGEVLDLEYNLVMSHIEEHKKAEVKKEAKEDPVTHSNIVKPKSEIAKSTTAKLAKPAVIKGNEECRSSRASSISSNCADELIENYAKENNLSYKNGNVFCVLCDSQLPTSLRSLKQHVSGMQHRNKLMKSKDNNGIVALPKTLEMVKQAIQEYVFSIIAVETQLYNDYIINQKYNISEMSFLMISIEKQAMKCDACGITLRQDEMDTHKVAREHIQAMAETMVIVSLDQEFVREPRADVFHCGFCAKAERGWEQFQLHLTSSSHRNNKMSASWRLRENLGPVSHHRWQDTMCLMTFLANLINRRGQSDDEWS